MWLIFAGVFSLVVLVIGGLVALILAGQQQSIDPSAAPDTTLSMNAQPANIKIDEESTIKIMMNTGANQVRGVDLLISFPANLVEVVDVQKSTEVPQASEQVRQIDQSGGKITFSLLVPQGQTPISGSRWIATLKVKGKAVGSAELNFASGTAVGASGENVNSLVSSTGTIIVIVAKENPPPPVNPTPTPPNPTPTPTPNPPSSDSGGNSNSLQGSFSQNCGNSTAEVSLVYKDGSGNPKNAQSITVNFDNQEKKVLTNEAGKTYVVFPLPKEGSYLVKMQPQNDQAQQFTAQVTACAVSQRNLDAGSSGTQQQTGTNPQTTTQQPATQPATQNQKTLENNQPIASQSATLPQAGTGFTTLLFLVMGLLFGLGGLFTLIDLSHSEKA